MASESFLIIGNPTAAGGRAVKRIGAAEHLLHHKKTEYSLVFTRSPGHAVSLARDAAERGAHGTVVAAGGDGTVNEVLNGLMEAAASEGFDAAALPDLAVLPVGRGNDFAYGAGIPPSVEDAVELIISGSGYRMDAGRIRGGMYPQGRYFGNGIGIGFDTIVGLEAAKAKWAPGFFGYVYGALKTFLLFPPAPRIFLSFPQGEGREMFEGRSHQISVMNGKRMGGTFYMAPNGDNSDGLFNLCMARQPLSRGEMFRAMLQYTKGTQGRNPLFYTDSAPRFLIEAPEGGLICHADGETITTEGTRLEIDCIPSALTLRGIKQVIEEEPEQERPGQRGRHM